MFSLPSAEVVVTVFLGGTGDGEGMKLEILRSGCLSFEGPNGGFLSATVFCAASLRGGNCSEAV